MKKVYVVHNRYVDSVMLMAFASYIMDIDGVQNAECGMGTKQNIDVLIDMAYEVPADVTKNDVMLAVEAAS